MAEHTSAVTGQECPFLLCLVEEPHTHPVCPECGAVRYGNLFCETCGGLRGNDLNPHTLIRVCLDHGEILPCSHEATCRSSGIRPCCSISSEPADVTRILGMITGA